MKKMLRNSLIALFVLSSSAFAAGGTVSSSEGGLLLSLFVGFFALILVFQLVPATIMLIGMIRGLLSGKTQVHY